MREMVEAMQGGVSDEACVSYIAMQRELVRRDIYMEEMGFDIKYVVYYDMKYVVYFDIYLYIYLSMNGSI